MRSETNDAPKATVNKLLRASFAVALFKRPFLGAVNSSPALGGPQQFSISNLSLQRSE